MRQIFVLFVGTIALTFSQKNFAQQKIATGSCTDAALVHQADSISKGLTDLGFTFAAEWYVQMESQYEQPVYLPLTKGVFYQIVFIADPSSRRKELGFFDGENRKLLGDVKNKQENNVIRFGHVPQITEQFLVILLQINSKKNDICGHLMVFKKIK